MARLLLISNSGRPRLGHCLQTMREFLGDIEEAVFVGAAAFMEPSKYLQLTQEAIASINLKLTLLDLQNNPHQTIDSAKAVLVGGGNTYKLLRDLKQADLLEPIRKKVNGGMPYIGWSAGSNITGPTILTTNDWNVVGLSDFAALNLVPFNINPHYQETDLTAAPYAETRDMRIGEYHAANENTVLGIEEQTSLWVEDSQVRVVGQGRVRRFERDQDPRDYRAPETIF